MAPERQPRRLDVDHGEAGQHEVLDVLDVLGLDVVVGGAVHARQPRPWV